MQGKLKAARQRMCTIGDRDMVDHSRGVIVRGIGVASRRVMVAAAVVII
jgi:hypothetical protein